MLRPRLRVTVAGAGASAPLGRARLEDVDDLHVLGPAGADSLLRGHVAVQRVAVEGPDALDVDEAAPVVDAVRGRRPRGVVRLPVLGPVAEQVVDAVLQPLGYFCVVVLGDVQ